MKSDEDQKEEFKTWVQRVSRRLVLNETKRKLAESWEYRVGSNGLSGAGVVEGKPRVAD
jgi:hypothetical protein